MLHDGTRARPDKTNTAKKKAKPKKIPVYSGPSNSGNYSRSAGAGSGGSGGGGGGGGGYNPNAITGAERRANAREKKAQQKAAAKYKEQSKTLGLQADALKRSLSSAGFLSALKQRLANAQLAYTQQDATLMDGYGKRVGSLEGAKSDNDKAMHDTSYAALANRGRERMAASKAAALHGAGESDTLSTRLMALRSWDSNQGEANRSFFDTLRSVNSSLTDLNQDTKTARINAASQLNADNDQLWTQYYNQKSDAFTQLGNIRGQQAELYGLANEQVGSKKSKKTQKSYSKQSGKDFMNASKYATKAPKNPGVKAELMNWEGAGEFKGRVNNTEYREASTVEDEMKKPQGATLRAW